MKTLIFSLFVFFSLSNLLAQNAGFKVLLTEGNNTFGQNQFITIGTEIPENQTINFQGEYLAMIDSEGKTIEITEKGIYEMKDLKGKSKSQINFTKKIIHLLAKGKNRKPYRSLGCALSLIKICGKSRFELYGDRVVMDWFLLIGAKVTEKDIHYYQVVLTDLADQILTTYRSDNQYIVIDMKKNLEDFPMIIAKVLPVGHQNNPLESLTSIDGITIQKLDSTDHQIITQEISQIQNPEALILSQLVLANFF